MAELQGPILADAQTLIGLGGGEARATRTLAFFCANGGILSWKLDRNYSVIGASCSPNINLAVSVVGLAFATIVSGADRFIPEVICFASGTYGQPGGARINHKLVKDTILYVNISTGATGYGNVFLAFDE